MENKKPPYDEMVPQDDAVPLDLSTLSVSEMLNQFRLIDARCDQIGISIKNNIASMVDDKISMRTQGIETHPCERMDTSIRILED